MRHKSDAMACYLDFEKIAEGQTGRLVQAVQSNRGGDYLSAEMEEHSVAIELTSNSQLHVLRTKMG